MAAPCGDSKPKSTQILADDRKRKRMESNRESARRSRIRKKIQLDELTSQVSELSEDGKKLAYALCETKRGCSIVEQENSVLRTQALELASRLQELELIVMMNLDDLAGDPWYLNQYYI